MKTFLLKKYKEKLVNLNDQFCFYLFSKEELNKKLENFSSSANPLFTTDLFKNNKYSKKIHITFEKLPDFQEENKTLNFGAYFSFSYEFVSSYIDDIITFLEKTNGVSLSDSQQKKPPEKRLKIALNQIGLGLPSQEYFTTLEYCRLRRNYFTHILESLNNRFQNLVSNQGVTLNSFWNTAITELDFSLSNVEEFSENETIELMKILKITLIEIDSFISGILNKSKVAEHICTELFETNPTRINTDVVAERKRKVLVIAKRDFDMTLTDSEMDNAVKTIGRR